MPTRGPVGRVGRAVSRRIHVSACLRGDRDGRGSGVYAIETGSYPDCHDNKVFFNNFNKSMPLRYEAGRRLFLKEAYASQLYNSFCYELHKNILPNIFERNFLKV